MLPLWDMLSGAQEGRGADVLAKQFALSGAQAQAAIDALLPAFSQGLKRSTSDPYGFGAFMAAVQGGQYRKYFEDASRAFSPQGMADGSAALGKIFGSEELARAVASQAAQATGIGQDILRQMLPALAAMMMGGFFKQMTDFANQAGANPYAEMMRQMMGAAGSAGAPPQAAADAPPNPWEGMLAANPLGKAFGEMWGVKAGEKPPQAPGANPFALVFEQWAAAAGATSAPPGQAPDSKTANPFAVMFETGRKQRDDYLRSMDTLFDRFAKQPDRPE